MNLVSIKPYNVQGNPYKKATVNQKSENKTQEVRRSGLLRVFNPFQKQILDEDEYFSQFLAKKSKVTKDEYEEIAKKHPSAIVKAYKVVEEKNPTVSSPAQVAKAAVVLKRQFDEEYKENYTIVSIGTSPSPITETMNALGARVVFLPASGLNLLNISPYYIFRSQYPTIASRVANVKLIVDYARKNGINSTNKSMIILMDYCCVGTSLSNMHEIFKQEEIVPNERLVTCSILEKLMKLTNFKKTNSIFTLEDQTNIAHDMNMSNFECVSNVPHFHVHDEKNKEKINYVSSKGKLKYKLFKEFEEYSQPLARAFALCSIHEAMKLQEENI